MRRRMRERSAAGCARPIGEGFLRRGDGQFDIAASLSGTCEYGLPVAGSMLSRYLPPTGSTNWPSMKF